MAPKPIVGYWDIRGRAEPIRLLLTYVGVDFVDKRYKPGKEGLKDKSSEWYQEKFNLGLDFPNLPYLIDGEVRLTQTIAILRYLARKYHLEGSSERLQDRASVLEQKILDVASDFAEFVHKKEPTEQERAEFVDAVAQQLELTSKFLGSNKFAVGDELTYVDFLLYENGRHVAKSDAGKALFAKFDNLQQYLARIEALPQLAEYLKKLNAAEK